jgi:hypothetical protein
MTEKTTCNRCGAKISIHECKGFYWLGTFACDNHIYSTTPLCGKCFAFFCWAVNSGVAVKDEEVKP